MREQERQQRHSYNKDNYDYDGLSKQKPIEQFLTNSNMKLFSNRLTLDTHTVIQLQGTTIICSGRVK